MVHRASTANIDYVFMYIRLVYEVTCWFRTVVLVREEMKVAHNDPFKLLAVDPSDVPVPKNDGARQGGGRGGRDGR